MSNAHGWATGPTSALTFFVLGIQVQMHYYIYSIYIYIYICVCVCVCVCMCMYVCMYVYMYVCMYVYVCMYMYKHSVLYIYIYIYIYIDIGTSILNIYRFMHIIHTYIYIYIYHTLYIFSLLYLEGRYIKYIPNPLALYMPRLYIMKILVLLYVNVNIYVLLLCKYSEHALYKSSFKHRFYEYYEDFKICAPLLSSLSSPLLSSSLWHH